MSRAVLLNDLLSDLEAEFVRAVYQNPAKSMTDSLWERGTEPAWGNPEKLGLIVRIGDRRWLPSHQKLDVCIVSDSAYTIRETATILGLCEETVRRMARDGRIEARKLGPHLWRVPAEEIGRLIGKLSVLF